MNKKRCLQHYFENLNCELYAPLHMWHSRGRNPKRGGGIRRGEEAVEVRVMCVTCDGNQVILEPFKAGPQFTI